MHIVRAYNNVLTLWCRLRPQEMASRHRVRFSSLSIIKTATVPAALCKRDGTKQFHNSKISFPVTQKLARCDIFPSASALYPPFLLSIYYAEPFFISTIDEVAAFMKYCMEVAFYNVWVNELESTTCGEGEAHTDVVPLQVTTYSSKILCQALRNVEAIRDSECLCVQAIFPYLQDDLQGSAPERRHLLSVCTRIACGCALKSVE